MRKLLAFLLATLLAFSICGCTKETEQPKTKPTQSVEQTVAKETEPPIDYSNLVTDARRVVIDCEKYGDAKEVVFAIPQINLDSDEITSVNKSILFDYDSLPQQVKVEISAYEFPSTSGGVSYEWYCHEDVLSLVIKNVDHPDATPCNSYSVYNISISEKRELSQDEVLALSDVKEEEYLEIASKAFGNYYLNLYDAAYEGMGDTEFFKLQFDATVEKSNVEKAVLFLNSDGELCAVADIYAIAGSGLYKHVVNISNYETNIHYNEFAD